MEQLNDKGRLYRQENKAAGVCVMDVALWSGGVREGGRALLFLSYPIIKSRVHAILI